MQHSRAAGLLPHHRALVICTPPPPPCWHWRLVIPAVVVWKVHVGFVHITFWRSVFRMKCCGYIEMPFRVCIRYILTSCSSNPAWIFVYSAQDMAYCEVMTLHNRWGNTAGVSTDGYYFPIYAAATWDASSHDSKVVLLLLELLGYWISDIYSMCIFEWVVTGSCGGMYV
jgi:hypothetical protein